MTSGPDRSILPGATGRLVEASLLVTGATGIVLLFLPFVWDIKPVADVFLDWRGLDPLWLLSAPCIVLPPAITAGYVVLLIKGGLPARARTASYALSGLCTLSILAGLGDTLVFEEGKDIVLRILFVAALAGGSWMLVSGVSPEAGMRGLVTMQAVYTIPMSFYLGAFASDLQIGGWFALVAMATYFTQVTLALRRFRWLLPLTAPVAAIALFAYYADSL